MATNDGLKVFLMTAQLIEEDLDAVEQDLALDLGRERATATGEASDYYPQIEHAFRAEAKEMAPHYEVFYSLERTIRTLVADSLEAADSAGWWSDPSRVPLKIKDDCESRLKKEEDTGVTLRSENPLDFSTFGELGLIITTNWDVVRRALQEREGGHTDHGQREHRPRPDRALHPCSPRTRWSACVSRCVTGFGKWSSRPCGWDVDGAVIRLSYAIAG